MKQVLVTVKSTQRDADGEDSVVELVSSGTYYKKKYSQHIVYEESEVTGLQGTKTTIKVYKDRVILLRTGQVSMRHEYRLGQTNSSVIETPFGQLELAMYTHELHVDIDDGKGVVHLGYDISLGGEWQFYNQLHIEIQEDRNYGNEGSLTARD